jgi:hypothetical protein
VSPGPPGKNVPDLVRRILESRGITLFALSRQSRERYPDPQYHIAHQLYSDLRLPGFTPSVPQLFALSSLTSYRLTDWLSVLGFPWKRIPSLQAILPAKRTRLIDSTLYDSEDWIPWFSDRPNSFSAVVPLGQLLAPGGFRKVGTFFPDRSSPFLYAKVGWQDVFAFPDLVPGSIVRVDTRNRTAAASGDSTRNIHLVEHTGGFCLCRVHAAHSGRLTIRSTELPYAQLELTVGRQVRILGTADAELRPLVDVRSPQVPHDLSSYGTRKPLPPASVRLAFGSLLSLARVRAGLSFREASTLTRTVAQQLSDPRYFCAPGALSHYETRNQPPRRMHKFIALSILYSLGLETLLGATGFTLAAAEQLPMPESVLSREQGAAAPADKPGFLRDLVLRFEEVPWFLADSVGTLAGLLQWSLSDIYWMGTDRVSRHPYLQDAVFAVLNRRSKKPVSLSGSTVSDQPLYILLTRSNGYLPTACHLEGNSLVAQPFADGFDRPRRFRNGIDAEVVGRVVALLRWLHPRNPIDAGSNVVG